MAEQAWVHSGWMSKQGHKYTGWKNRYFVLTEDTLSYYKEEVAEGSSGTRAGALAGTLSLREARVFPTMWAPDGMFGWMIVTEAGVKYPFRCFGFKDRETWLKKVNALSCINTTEVDKKQATTSSWGIAESFKRISFGGSSHGHGEATKRSTQTQGSPFKPGAGNAETQQQLTLFLTEAGLRHLVSRFVDSGVRSVSQLCVEVSNPTMTDEILMAPPLSMRMGEIEKLRNAVETAAQNSDMAMKQFLSENNLNQYLEKLEAYGINSMKDLVDLNILNNDDLSVEIGMNAAQVSQFRNAANAWTTEHASDPEPSSGYGQGGGDVEDDEDEENEERMTMDEFFMLRNDVINSAHAQLGMPYIGRHGKCHPIFDIVLVGMKKSKRVRSYRFRTLRIFQEEQVMNETGFYIQRLATSFPGTLTKSRFGLQLSESELEDRVKQLSVWVDELLRVRGAMSPRLRRATLMLLQLDESQLFPESLTLGRTDDTNAAASLPPLNTAANSAMPPPIASITGNDEVVTEVSISKGASGLGLDMVPVNNGKVIISIVRPYSGVHPADIASPPLMDGDEIVAVNGVKFGDNLDLLKSTIASAPTNLTLTIKRTVVGSVGALLGEWNVAMGNASLFVTAHETIAKEGSRRGFLFIVMDVSEGWRCAMFVPPVEVNNVTSQHFGASMLGPNKGLQLAKLFGNFFERTTSQSFSMKTPDGHVFSWSVKCDGNDTIQVCYQRAFDEHRRSSAAAAKANKRRTSANASSMANVAAQAMAANASTGAGGGGIVSGDSGVRYGLSVDNVGPVSGVPATALRTIDTKQPLSNVFLGQKVEIDFKTHWGVGVITEIQEPSPSFAMDSNNYQQPLEEDSEGEDDVANVTVTPSEFEAEDFDGQFEELVEGEAVEINDQFGGLMSFEEFKDSLTRGIEVVKFNRRGNAAFRTLALIGDHTLTWMTPKDALKGMSDSDAKKSKGNFDLRELISVRPGEALDPDAKKEGETGTATLRMYASKHQDGKEMQATGHCLSLIFPGRSVDVATDSVAHRDFLMNGFRLLAQRGPSGGRLLSFELTNRSKQIGFQVKAEVKSSGVVEMVLAVHTVVQGSEADKIGLKAGDRLYQINNQQQNKWLSKKPSTPTKFAGLVQVKLNKLSNSKKPTEIVVERLDLDKHLVASEAATTLKVAKERKLAEWLRAHNLEKFTVNFIKLGVGSVDELKQGKISKAELMAPKKVGMTKADLKKFTRALDTYVIVDDGAAEVVPGKPDRRGSLQPGTETSRAGVSFGLKGPHGGRLVSVTLTEKAVGLTVGNVTDPSGKNKVGVFVLAVKEGSDAEVKGIQIEDRLHMINNVTLPLSMSHKTVRSKVKAAKRPMHLVLERLKQETNDFISATEVAMNGFALTAAEEMEMESLLDLKALILESGNEKAAAWMSTWSEDNPITDWFHIKTEKMKNGRTIVTDLDISNLDLSISLGDLRQALLGLNYLRDLAFSGNALMTGDINQLDEEALPNIKTLYLHNCPLITGHVSSLYCLSSLVTLNIDNNEKIFGDQKEIKQRLTNLKVLSMRGLAPAAPSF